MLAVGIAFESPPLFAMSSMLFSIVAWAVVSVLIGVRRIRIERKDPQAVTAGKEATLTYAISGGDSLPHWIAELAGESSQQPVSFQIQGSEASCRVFFPRSGRISLNRVRVWVADPFGLVSICKSVDAGECVLLVLPQMTRFVFRQTPSSRSLGSTQSASLRRGEGDDVWGVRQFGPGDALSRIHWRATARTGRLLVKEFEDCTGKQATLLLRLPPGVSDAVREQLLGQMAFAADHFLRIGTQVTLLGNGALGPVSTPFRLPEVFRWLLSQEPLDKAAEPFPKIESCSQLLFFMVDGDHESEQYAVLQRAAGRGMECVVAFPQSRVSEPESQLRRRIFPARACQT